MLGEKGGGLGRHVFKFVSDDVDMLGETRERQLVLVIGDRARVHDIERAGVLVGRIDVAFEPERCGGKGEHARKLAAAEDADRGAGIEGCHA